MVHANVLTIRDYKGISWVSLDLTESGDVVMIAGPNGAGKTSVLDALAVGLNGPSAVPTARPIRDGAESAEIVIQLDDYTVVRKITETGTTLVLRDKFGVKISKPQDTLNSLIGKLSFDPQKFQALKPKEQLDVLLDVLELDFNPAELAAQRATAFDARRDTSRELKSATAVLDGMPHHADAPEAEQSFADAMAARTAAQERNQKIKQAHDNVSRAEQDLETKRGAVFLLKEKLAEAEANERAAVELAEKCRAFAASAPAPVDLTALDEQISNLETVNAKVRANTAHNSQAATVTALESRVAELNGIMTGIDKIKSDGLAAAVLPMDNIGFDDDMTTLTIDGVPFAQVNTGQRFEASMYISAKLSKGLRIMRISDGSLLDQETLRRVRAFIEKNDYQLFIETVGFSDDEDAWNIEGGQLATR